jgi:hypothetical protein
VDNDILLEVNQHDMTLMKTRHFKSLKLFEENTTINQHSTYRPNEIIFKHPLTLILIDLEHIASVFAVLTSHTRYMLKIVSIDSNTP